MHVITRLLQAGAEENTIATCLHQARTGHQVTLVHGGECHAAWTERLKDRVELVPLPSLHHEIAPLSDARATWQLRQFFAARRPDVVHTHQSKAGIVGRLAAAAAGVPLIVHTVHIAPFVNVTGARRLIYLWSERLCAKVSHLIIAVSRGMQDAYADGRVAPRSAVHVIHSGMPVAKFASGAAPTDWRERIGGWDAQEKPAFILMLAAFEPRKRQREFLHAVAPYLRANPNVCLLLGGEGPERGRCEEESRRLGLERQVRFLGHDPKPEELIALSTVCILTSEREGLPRSVVQYLAGGKPVVISDLPGIDELVSDGVNGIVSGADDLAETAERVFDVLGDELLLARLTRGAQSTDVGKWDEDTMGERIAAAYRAAEPWPHRDISAIEFFGLPGAGKTTVARKLVESLRGQGETVTFSAALMGDDESFARRSLRRLMLLREFARRPRLGARRLSHLMSRRGSLKDRAKSCWNYCSVLAMCLRHGREGRGICVLDQGPVQAIWTARMHGEERPGDDYAALLAEDGLQDCLFVHVAVDDEVARSRLAKRARKTSRLQRTDSDDGARWERARGLDSELADIVRDALRERGLEHRFIELRSSAETDASDAAELVLARFKSLEAANAGA